MTQVIIMGVPWDPQRVRRVKALQEATDAITVWDRHQDIMETFTRCLAAAGTDAAIFLQDDVYLHPRWRQLTQEAIDRHPDVVHQFFSIRKSDIGKATRLVRGSDYLMNQCYYLPAGMAAELLEFTKRWIELNPGHTGDDTCISDYLRSRGLKYMHHVPSLVQHEEWPSVTGKGRSTKRQSHTFEEST